MRILLKVCLICWGISGALILFLTFVPTTTSPTTAAVLSILIGSGFLAWFAFRLRRIRKEGFESGFFLARQHGIRLSVLGFVGLVLFLIGALWLVAPQQTDQLFEQSAMPIAKCLVGLFWFSVIFAVLGFALACFAESVGYWRLRNFKWAAGSFALATFWLAPATLFCSLFLNVVNDVFFRLSATTQNYILALFALAAVVIGLWAGRYQDLKALSSDDESAEDAAEDI